jgi:Fe-S-cluster containining protein
MSAMADDERLDDGDLPAGDFSTWLTELQGALAGERSADVPCGSCTACCASSQFVHIGPDETESLAHVPAELQFPAPGLPRGHVLLGYDERGHCPMLVDGGCSIYEHRPRTCRTYDCRVFPAAGIAVEDPGKVLIDRRARRWRFEYGSPDGVAKHTAVKAAAVYLRDDPDSRSAGSATQLAVLAVEIHDLFLQRDRETGRLTAFDPDHAAVRVELRRRTTPRGLA